MLAVLKNGGKQYLVRVGDVIRLEKINIKVGDFITFTQVTCLIKDENSVNLDKLLFRGVQIWAEILSQQKIIK